MSDINDSILESVRKLCNADGDEYFNPDLIIHINTVFAALTQMGVGPEDGFQIEDNTATWSEYTNDDKLYNMVKTYMALKVKLLFDISTASSYYVDTMQKQCDEYEWRLNVYADNYYRKEDDP